MIFYLFIFTVTTVFSALFTWGVIHLARYFKIIDQPDKNLANYRKIHKLPTPLLGGLAVFAAYFLALFIWSDHFLAGDLQWSHLWGFAGGALIIILGGILDDKYNLSPQWQIIFPVLAVGAVIMGGVEIARLSSPIGGIWDLSPYSWLSSVIIGLWLLGLMYTTKLLDGVDGLVSGLGLIGGIIIFLFTLTTRYYQPDIALAALLLAGATAGFLIFNWHPAKIFLGEGGSLLIGYILGVLSIISGGKIAMALLIMGLPILDVFWTIIRRWRAGQNPFKFSDRRHLHHRLLSLGLNQIQTVTVFYSASLIFGLSGLFLQSQGKLWALLALFLIMLLSIMALELADHRRQTRA